jgi:hypothetical protein
MLLERILRRDLRRSDCKTRKNAEQDELPQPTLGTAGGACILDFNFRGSAGHNYFLY